MIGLDPGTAIGLRLSSPTDARGFAETVPLWQQAMAHPGERVRTELRSIAQDRDDGRPQPRLEISITNHLDHPSVRGVVVHLHDVTNLVRAKANYQNLVDQSLQGIAVVRGFRIVYANQGLAALDGLELDRLVGVHVDEAVELEQVFVNLIRNAIQAQHSSAQVRISARARGHEIEVLVEDDGPGIPLGERDRIFDPFYTTRLEGGGPGLGLSVAHGFVADHGGRMELLVDEARADVGACFRVRLPIGKSERGIPTS